MPEDASRRTPTRPIRVPVTMWEAYGRVCDRIGVSRTEDLLNHMRDRIREGGGEQELADLAAAENELATRRARRGGRPPLSGGGQGGP